ncbi:hypothetical protein K493DRAFT_217020 [Basidiobolus meristosporus CBS 931.73]|uniref:Rhodanese domain-containing protein n=1 Tax=Basidiobolus meristosporus CBS 931.73 TaxID=1314790 RepID=A0A1Y1YF83_9FUNG|nr:hypothetical protein K493DRAFT_217020 [Basidiobolus meristosporus CBS 931.73]|eukprot:ORX96700.1 hypothetical protein K493DRAFT_217020 [Basidiobolus meristosporus CBS 931.73]
MEEQLRLENAELRRELEQVKRELDLLKSQNETAQSIPPQVQEGAGLTNAEIQRYGRQLILPDIGIKGQKKLKNASVLVVGAGGLGSPCILYLCAAGVGRLGIVDHDVVDNTNLHRQVIHDERREGMSKAASAKYSCNKLNSFCDVQIYDTLFNSDNALEIIQQYDVVVDCTDNVATRYLINDACVMAKKPLVSGSAVRMDGQLTIYNYNGGPCYRCLFPTPPPPESVTNCADGGVLGVVPGIIGCLEALETIKVITGLNANYKPNLLVFSAAHTPAFRSIKLRAKKHDCAVCGDEPTVTSLIDYVQFCGSGALDKLQDLTILDSSERVSCTEYSEIMTKDNSHLLLDCREKVQFEICQLPNSTNIPWSQFERQIDGFNEYDRTKPVYVVCRRGNDSQQAVRMLQSKGWTNVKDIAGGLVAWTKEVDSEFPLY